MSTPEIPEVPPGQFTIPLGMTDTSSDSASVASKTSAPRKAPATPRKRTASSAASGWKVSHPPALVAKVLEQDSVLKTMHDSIVDVEKRVKVLREEQPALVTALKKAEEELNKNKAELEEKETILSDNKSGYEHILALKIAKLKK